MTLEELVAGFRAGQLSGGAFSHREHLRVAWWYLRHEPDGMARFAADLRHFAQCQGAPELYHDTITWAYLFALRERLAREEDGDCDGFLAAYPDLLQKEFLHRYYKPETLQSELARKLFVLPDQLST